jgi:hypothetical protein
MKVWVIEQGEYSDYSVGPLFATKELGEAWIAREKLHNARHYYGEPSLSEWDVLEELPEQVHAAYITAEMDANGNLSNVSVQRDFFNVDAAKVRAERAGIS